MNKHTPGPWRVDAEEGQDIGVAAVSDGVWICAFTTEYGEEPYGHGTIENARLVAAAPDLARVLLAYINLKDDDGQTVYALDALHAEMTQVLRKAGFDVPLYESEV